MAAESDPNKRHSNYDVPIKELKPEARELLLEYANVPEEDVLEHVHRMRDKAWETCPYGCVGAFAFTFPTIQRADVYEEVLERIKSGQLFLDLGCGFGQNTRKLVHDGAPSENTFGADISKDFISHGYEYFRDKSSLKTKFIFGDVLDTNSSAFLEAEGSFDIIFASMFYHLWGWDDHVKTLIRTIKLLKPVPGSMLFGWQLGGNPAMEINRGLYKGRLDQHKLMYLHNEDSWVKMWKELEEQTGTKWEVHVRSIITPEIQARQDILPENRKGVTTLVAILFSMKRL